MNDRQEKIYAILKEQGTVSVEHLKKVIFASEATLRRDLTKMEQDGLLLRTWGGAMLTAGIKSDPPSFIRSNSNINEKNTIARLALHFVQNNMTVFLASGTTVTKLASLFYKRENLTVITNGLDTTEALKNSASQIILTGGALYENYDMTGLITDNTIDQFNADIFFFSCSGLTAEGFSSMDMLRLNVIKKMKNNSAKTILLADNSKVGKKYSYRGFGFEDIDYVIMDSVPNDRALVKALGKKLITAKRI